MDSIVRVSLTRLRKHLNEYYADRGKYDPVVFRIPKREFRVILEFREMDSYFGTRKKLSESACEKSPEQGELNG